eukprot:3803685-Rhodomonas_salina.1
MIFARRLAGSEGRSVCVEGGGWGQERRGDRERGGGGGEGGVFEIAHGFGTPDLLRLAPDYLRVVCHRLVLQPSRVVTWHAKVKDS